MSKNPFGNVSSEGLEQSEDRLGGGRFIFDTDVYDATILLAYAGQSQGGARNMTFSFDIGGKRYDETIYVTNRKGENWFLNQNDQTKKVPLPGFTIVNDLCLCTVSKELSEIEFEEKVINLYDFDQKKEVPTSVMMAVELIGSDVGLAIVKTLEDKTKNDGNGNYVPTGETIHRNNIEKVFNLPSNLTVPEARDGKTESVFRNAWLDKNKGQVRDKTNKDGGQQGKPTVSRGAGNAPQPGGSGGAAPRKSLFGK